MSKEVWNMKTTATLLAAEFKQKSRWSKVPTNVTYGTLYLVYGPGRNIPFQSVNWVTRDSNRLINFTNRYAKVVKELDMPKNEEELKVQLPDVRWNDHRRLYFKCQTCGEPYRRAVSSVVKFHAGCSACRYKKRASEVLGEQLSSCATLASSAENKVLVQQLAGSDAEKIAAEFTETSKFAPKWSCSCCKKEYRASIRQRTGKVAAGQAPVSPLSKSWTAFCDDCRWAKNMAPIGQQALAQRHFLGLGELQTTSAAPSPRIPRRKKYAPI